MAVRPCALRTQASATEGLVVSSQPIRFVDGVHPPKRTHRRAPRATLACETCRTRKTKCDQQLPCSYCEGVFSPTPSRHGFHQQELHLLIRKPTADHYVGLMIDHDLECSYRKPGAAPRLVSNTGRVSRRNSSSGPPRTFGRRANGGPPTSGKLNKPSTDSYPDNFINLTTAAQPSYVNTNSMQPVVEGTDLRPGEPQTAASRQEVWYEDLPADGNTETTGLGGVNSRTSGTEFYGDSSSLASLHKVFAKAARRAESYPSLDDQNTTRPNDRGSRPSNAELAPKHLKNRKLSIVNLMYSSDYISPEPEGLAPLATGSGTPYESHISPMATGPNGTPSAASSGGDIRRNAFTPSLSQTTTHHTVAAEAIAPKQESSRFLANDDIERIFVQTYFTNKHYIHPFLDEAAFKDRCDREILSTHGALPLRRANGKPASFLALYYAVVATGAINAGIDDASLLSDYYRNIPSEDQRRKTLQVRSTLEWAATYFELAKRSLGDIFETCVLETCQALFLMTIFCQNALKPHACYMYSGTAVRTAIAIGLANKTGTDSPGRTREARRTWWCIYSHEVEMCCSSGRLDGLKHPRHYSTPFPKWTNTENAVQGEVDGPHVAMIEVMISMSQIHRKASKDIYHDAEQPSIHERSRISFELEDALIEWQEALPAFLKINKVSLSDPEWAYKQKLVLRMRLYNAQILIHRPFLIESSNTTNSSAFSRHFEICLDAARRTIGMIYDSFTHRIYLRTWWYCVTYTLYATMIILHLIFLDFPKVPGEDLIQDVEKGREIFLALKRVKVARRCAELTKEILGVAKKHLHDRVHQQTTQAGPSMITRSPLLAPYQGQTSSAPYASEFYRDETIAAQPTGSEAWNDSYLMALLNQEQPVSERAHVLANLFDPTTIQDFAVGGTNNYGNSVISPDDTWMSFTLGGGVNSESGQVLEMW